MNVIDILKERGYIEQLTHEKELRKILENETISFYVGFDPTADSLHVGHFIPIMVMSHLQQHGHQPIALCGGGTGLIGDPSGKTDMRKFLDPETIRYNISQFKNQLSRFIDFTHDRALMLNNASWLLDLNYISLLRDIGPHFSVNRMLSSEAFKIRMERELGLSFLEFNYMILQAYDFLKLNRDYECKLQIGGNDQWSNIIAGIELIRRMDQREAYGMTLSLLTNSAGEKMGKTVSGALWLDRDKKSPYEFFQYWRNIDDQDVYKCLCLLTFLEMNEIKELTKEAGKKMNHAKEVLAFEVTKMVHSEEDAKQALDASLALFGDGSSSDYIPSLQIDANDLSQGLAIIDVLLSCNFVQSRSDARRVISQGAVKINDKKITNAYHTIVESDFVNGRIIIQKGKKNFYRIVIAS